MSAFHQLGEIEKRGSWYGAADLGISLVPVAGPVWNGAKMLNSINQGDWRGAAGHGVMTVASAVPGVGGLVGKAGMGIGRRALQSIGGARGWSMGGAEVAKWGLGSGTPAAQPGVYTPPANSNNLFHTPAQQAAQTQADQHQAAAPGQEFRATAATAGRMLIPPILPQSALSPQAGIQRAKAFQQNFH